MKYAGSVIIVDDKGEVVLERELSADAIIEVILGEMNLSPLRPLMVSSASFDGSVAMEPGKVSILPNKEVKKSRGGGAPKKESKKKGYACKKCGEHGHNQKTCKVGKEVDMDDVQVGPMTERQFNSVRTSREHMMKSVEIASEMALTLQEVNHAFASATYNGYLERRRKN